MKKSWIIVPLVVVLGFAYFHVAGRMELGRSATPLQGTLTSSGPTVNTAILMEDVRTLASPAFGGRRTGSDGSKLAQAYIAKRFTDIGLQPFGASYVQPFSFSHTSLKGLVTPGKPYKTEYPSAANLVGFIKGSKYPDRYIVVSAHYDHLGTRNGQIYAGADDNASGVAAMLAVAASFKTAPPEHTIVFAAFDSEELGKRGAQAFIGSVPFGRDKLVLNVNLDMVSRSNSNEIWASGLYHNPRLKALVEDAAKRSTVRVKAGHDKPVYLAGAVEDWTDSSDHGAFHDVGVPYLYFGVEDHADYHQSTDTAEKINPGFFTSTASLLVDVVRTADSKLAIIR